MRVLRQRWFDEEIQSPKRHPQLPTVLSAEEITQILDGTRNRKHWTILATFYATGLRCKELRLLKVEDIDSKRMLNTERQRADATQRDPLPGPTAALTYLFALAQTEGLAVSLQAASGPTMDSKSIRRLCENAGRRAGIQAS